MSGYRVCERCCPEHTAAEIGQRSERWRWDVEEAIQACEHALKPHDIVAFDGCVMFSEVLSSILTSEERHAAFWSKWSHQEHIMLQKGEKTRPSKSRRKWEDHGHLV